MSDEGFNPEVFAIGQKITRDVFGEPEGKEDPKPQSKIPKWNKKQRRLAISDPIMYRDYFSYPGGIDWNLVPPLKLQGVTLSDPKKAQEKLNKRMEAYMKVFYLPRVSASTAFAVSMQKTRYHRRELFYREDVWGRFEDRTWSKTDREITRLVGLKGSELIEIWRRFGIDVLATWADQVSYDPSGGTPMSHAGTLIRQKYADWEPGAWEWHRNEYLVPGKMYTKFRFPQVNIRLLFHLIEKHKLVFTTPPPARKEAR